MRWSVVRMRALQRALTGIFADTSSCSLSEKDKEEDEPPACERTECGVELPKLRLFLFALNLSSSSLSSSAPRNSHGSTCLFARAMRRQPVRQQNNTKGSRTLAPRAPMGSPPAADTRPGVRQQTLSLIHI